MTTISKNAQLITLINVFTVDPSHQPRLVELLTQVTDTFVRRARGFIGSSLHRSRDGTKVTMYAQWRSLDDYETMRREPGHTAYDFAQQRCASECSRKSKVFDQGFRGRLTQF